MSCPKLDLRPKRIDILFTRKDSVEFGFTFYDQETGLPLDLTGTTFLLTVNEKDDGTGVDLFTLAQSNTPGIAGVVKFTPSAANNDQALGNYYYDVEWSVGPRTLVAGIWSIEAHISN